VAKSRPAAERNAVPFGTDRWSSCVPFRLTGEAQPSKKVGQIALAIC